jgi:putative PepSY-like beta-lactamase-inhibitor
MKNLVFLFATILTLSILSSCNKDDNNIDSTEVLIEEITASSAKQDIAPEDLPATTKSFIEEEHFETYVETVSFVEGKGYEVTLGTEDIEYFNRDGDVLRTDRNPHRCHRPGPCGGGERIRLNQLPDAITTYIADNYPDQEMKRAKIKGNFYLVGITGPTILVFELDGTFVAEAPLFRFCNAQRIDIANLPDSITSYVSDNCPDGVIKAAFKVRGKIVVGIQTPDGRKIYVFNLDGEFLFERL